MIDFNCFIGSWAFYPTFCETVQELKALHEKNGITGGWVSSLKSVTYRDYFYSEEELHHALKGTGYRHVMTVDPRFPACADIVKYGIENWDIVAVRIVPGFQGYKLTDTRLEDLCKLLEEKNLPLLLTMHMQDDRNCYLVQNVPPTKDEVNAFLGAHHGLKILVCNALLGEVEGMQDALVAHPKAFCDLSGMRSRMGTLEYLTPAVQERLVFGTMTPLVATGIARLHLEVEDLTPAVIEQIKTGSKFM